MTSLLRRLEDRARQGRPVGVGLVGAGTFGAMFLAQARRVSGLRVLAVADMSVERAGRAVRGAGFDADHRSASAGATLVTDDPAAVWEHPGVDVVVDATGDAAAAARHTRAAVRAGRHVVNATVEADALLGPLLAREAEAHGVVYSFAYGDQPALICELVDWARINGFDVVCAGKGTKFLPRFHSCSPDAVWQHYGFDRERVEAGGYDARMFTSFLDGTKSAIEMAAVANATGLEPQAEGLGFPPAGVDDLAEVCRPASRGGRLSRGATVEVVSSLARDGSPVPRDLRWGVFVVVEGPSPYVRRCFADYGLTTDDEGTHAALYRPCHLVGLELVTSIASVALRGEATGAPRDFLADVVAVAKRDLPEGMELDGEGGYAVYGRLMPAAEALATRALPIGLACGVRTTRYLSRGEIVGWDDVEGHPDAHVVALRAEMERRFVPPGAARRHEEHAAA
jgi:predicted homoserine dehydrogenase-like protein